MILARIRIHADIPMVDTVLSEPNSLSLLYNITRLNMKVAREINVSVQKCLS